MIVTGGLANSGGAQKTTSIVEVFNDQVTSGPDLIVERYEHACNTIEIGTKKYAIVVGGSNSNAGKLTSTELLDLDQLNQGSWISGPDLPVAINQLRLVSTSPTSLYSLGGEENIGRSNKVYKLNCSGTTVDTCQWVEHQTLPNARSYFVAITLTDFWVSRLCP